MSTPLNLQTILAIPELPQYLNQVERELADVLTSDNPFIRDPLLRLLKARGKRLRPTLVIAVAISQGRKIDQAVISGCVAVELVHIASLVHDDIIDNADTRWNIPTINSREGSSHAIIIGDYLLGKAGMVAATVSPQVALVIGSAIVALCDGQSRELTDQHNIDRTIDSLYSAASGKTAALISAACRVGGLCAELTPPQLDAIAKYGHGFGMAFQLIDDILDYLSTDELSGKPVGNDIKEGMYTLPLLLALQGPESKTVRTLISEQTNSPLVTMLVQVGAMKEAMLEVYHYSQEATNALKAFDDEARMTGLRDFPNAYADWALTHLVADTYQPAISKLLKQMDKGATP